MSQVTCSEQLKVLSIRLATCPPRGSSTGSTIMKPARAKYANMAAVSPVADPHEDISASINQSDVALHEVVTDSPAPDGHTSMISTSSASPVKSAGLRVTNGRPSATATDAMSRSATRLGGVRP